MKGVMKAQVANIKNINKTAEAVYKINHKLHVKTKVFKVKKYSFLRNKVKNNKYVEEIKGRISLNKLKKNIGSDHFIFQNPTLQINSAYKLNKEMYLVKGIQVIDMRRYGRSGFKKIPFQLVVSKTGNSNFACQLIDRKGTPKNLKINLAPNKDKAAFTIGNGKVDLYMFTDPDCPFCIQFEKAIQSKGIKNKYKIYVYLFPLEALHPNSRKKSEWILSQPKNKRYEMYQKVMGPNTKLKSYKTADTSKGKKLLKPMIDYGNSYVGVRGTPYIVDETGKPINRNIILK